MKEQNKPNWQVIDDVMTHNKTITITDNLGDIISGKIEYSDIRALFIDTGGERHEIVFLRDIVDYKVEE